MSKDDLEKNAALPSLADVYGGVEDNRQVGGVAEHQDAIASSSSSSPETARASSGSWFTKKRIIIIAIVAIIIVAGAVGGGVGGALGNQQKSGGDDSSSSTGSSSDQTINGTSNVPTPTATGNGGANGRTTDGGNNATPITVGPNAGATGIILPTGVTAVAFSGVPKPSVTGTPMEINLGFPGLTPNSGISAETLVQNGEFKQNLTGWENIDGCWDVNDWDDKGYLSAWIGEHSSARSCELAQAMDRGSDQGKDTDYVVSFLYRNALAKSSDNAWLWAYIGDEDQMFTVLATKEAKPTSEDEWNKAAYKYTVKANKKARIAFRGSNDMEYWEVSEVQVVPLAVISDFVV